MNTHQFCFKPSSVRPGAVICIEVTTETETTEPEAMAALRAAIVSWLAEKGVNPPVFLAPDLAYSWSSSDRWTLADALLRQGITNLNFVSPSRTARNIRADVNLLDTILGEPAYGA